MKVTKEQKIYLGLLAIGLIALAMDRFIFAPPTAEAADATSDLLVKPADKPAAHAAPGAAANIAAAASNPIAQKLVGLSESMHLSPSQVKDAFTPAASWCGNPTSATDIKSFAEKHHLNGVMFGRRPAAMVDGDLVVVGQTVDGLKLITVSQGAATFQAGDLKVTLRAR